MATWATLDGNDIPILQEIANTINDPAIQQGFNALITALQAANTALSAVEAVLVIVDAIVGQDPTVVVVALIDALINDIIEQRAGVLYVKPTINTFNVRYRGYAGFGRLLKDSLNDRADLERPQFAINDASGGVVFLISAPTFQELQNAIALFQQLFGDEWSDVIDFINALPGLTVPRTRIDVSGTVTAIPEGADPRFAFTDSGKIAPNGSDLFAGQRIQFLTGLNTGVSRRAEAFSSQTGVFRLNPGFPNDIAVGDLYLTAQIPSGSTPPDWRSKLLIEVFPILGEAVAALARIRDQIPSGAGLAAALARVIDLLQRKINLLQRILVELQALVQRIADITTLLSQVNVNVLPVPIQQGGNIGFINEFSRANNKPNIADDAVTAGVVVYGGSGLVGTLTLLLTPLFP